MSNDNNKKDETLGDDCQFNKKRYGIPFGKYSSSGYSPFPSNEHMVGRENARAELINFLTHGGPRGAYLVTGRRGVGKTSFVDYCVKEYEESVCDRFLRNNVARTLWDLLWLAFLGILTLLSLLVYIEFAIELLANKNSTHIYVVFFVPICIFVLWLLLYSKRIVEKLLGREKIRLYPTGIISIIIVAGIFSYFLIFTNQKLASTVIYHIILLTSLSYSITQCLSYNNNIEFKNLLYYIILIITLGAAWFPVTQQFDTLYLEDRYNDIGNNIKLYVNICNLMLLSNYVVAIGLLFRLIHLSFLVKSNVVATSVSNSISLINTRNQVFMVFSFMVFFGLVSILLIDRLTPLSINWEIEKLWLFGLQLVVSYYMYYFVNFSNGYDNKNKLINIQPDSFRPRPAVILSLKALSAIVLATFLVRPFIANLYVVNYFIQDNDIKSFVTSDNILAPKYFSENNYNWMSETNVWFMNNVDQYLGIIGIFILGSFIYLIEYSWIVRPLITAREDRVLNPDAKRSWADSFNLKSRQLDEVIDGWGCYRKYCRTLERLTLPSMAYRLWMPALVSTINLGFDRLDHRSVIQAMLVSLRQEYYKKFLAWNSIHANIRRFVLVFIVIIFVTAIGKSHFSYPEIDNGKFYQKYFFDEINTCVFQSYGDEFKNYASMKKGYILPPIPESICNISLGAGKILIPILYYTIIDIKCCENKFSANHMLFYLFHENRSYPNKYGSTERYKNYSSFSIRIYHGILFLFVLAFVRWFGIRFYPFTHIRILAQIDDLLDSLSGVVSVKKSRDQWKPARWIYSLFFESETKQINKEIADPRAVELAFLNVIEDVRRVRVAFPVSFSENITTSTVEITFVFDELDKLSTETGYPDVYSNKETLKTGDSKLERSASMHQMLSDLKRILSSAPARFIFVGGRELHDEWLSDSTRRQPLLTSIFQGQIYIPSLMVDHSGIRDGQMDQRLPNTPEQVDSIGAISESLNFHTRTWEFLVIQYFFAWQRYGSWISDRWASFFGLRSEPQFESGFSQWLYSLETVKRLIPRLKIIDCETGRSSGDQEIQFVNNGEDSRFEDKNNVPAIVRSFVHYITYRSAGNPKRIKEIFSEYVRSSARFISKRNIAEEKFLCRDIVFFSDNQILKIQLISSIYQHLREGFEKQLLKRDDKIVVSLFYLTDFLLKFHSKAFAWENLEQIDELVDIHQAPDVRQLLEELLNHFSERYLHKVLNGMYVYRFRSDFAKEIEYLSRHSESEMVAFNFTLDESQALKQIYHKILAESDRNNSDLLAKLGDLYEYDQEFERARHYYRHSIAIVDKQLEYVVGKDVDSNDGDGLLEILSGNIPPLKAIFGQDESGVRNASYFLSWGPVRLRLMLKIGMTFELSRSLERAFLQYRQCMLLSNALIKAYLESNDNIIANDFIGYEGEKKNQNQILKHLNIIYQPIFACAWVCEKWQGGVDTAGTILEEGLRELRFTIPFLNNQTVTITEPSLGQGVSHSNFALVGSQLHTKAGNLYFFKGTQVKVGAEGYLLRSHYHYAVSLHEIRRFIYYRISTSKGKYSLPIEGERPEAITVGGSWPNFPRLGVAEGITDMAENTLARIPVVDLFKDLVQESTKYYLCFRDREGLRFMKICTKWFESNDDDTCQGNKYLHSFGHMNTNNQSLKISLGDWFGGWRSEFSSTGPMSLLLDFKTYDRRDVEFLMSLNLSIVSAGYIEEAGYLEDAAREYLQLCDTVAQFLWLICSIHQLVRCRQKGGKCTAKRFPIKRQYNTI